MSSHQPVRERRRLRFSAEQQVDAPPEEVFPLLCPVREYDWIPGWDCTMVYSETGLAEPGCVFQTDREADGGLDTWVISHHEPSARIGFVRVNPLRAIQYLISLEPAGGGTRLRWEQVMTGLSEAGDRHLDSLRESDFLDAVATMEKLLGEYLASGHGAGA